MTTICIAISPPARAKNAGSRLPAAFFQYAKENGLADICLTDHFWDEAVPPVPAWQEQSFAALQTVLPLPQGGGIHFHFGCEAEMDRDYRLGLAPEHYDAFELILIATSHLHLGFTTYGDECSILQKAVTYICKLEHLLSMPLPFEKIGLPHLTTSLIATEHPGDHFKVLDSIPDSAFRDVFREFAHRGSGIELNAELAELIQQNQAGALRPFFIAKEVGCKFYFGSDGHIPDETSRARSAFEAISHVFPLDELERFEPFGATVKSN